MTKLAKTSMEERIAPSQYLIDELISYAEDARLSFEDAAAVVGEFAKQRAPELSVERQARHARSNLLAEVVKSRKEKFVARFLVRTRVRYISWTYYPEYHVFDAPANTWWCSIRYEEPDWGGKAIVGRFYLDDLFHDPDGGRFWMHEPYLNELPESLALFGELTKKEHEILHGTSFKKIDPRIVKAFKAARAGAPQYAVGYLEGPNWSRKPPYGSKGWQERVALVPMSYQRVRLKL